MAWPQELPVALEQQTPSSSSDGGQESRGADSGGGPASQLISVLVNNGPFCKGVTQLVCLWHGPDREGVLRVWRRAQGRD